jgi:tetratricopeptide (TPR) repeat protein
MMKNHKITTIIILLCAISIICVFFYQQKRKNDQAMELNNKASEMIVKYSYDSAKIDTAIVYLNKAALLNSQNKSIYPNLVNAYFLKKQYRNALNAMQNYLQMKLSSDEKIGASFIKGIAYYCLGLEDSSKMEWTNYDNYYKNKEKETNSFNDNFQRLSVLVLLGKKDEAIELGTKLKLQNPKMAENIDASYRAFELIPCLKDSVKY